MAFTLSQPAWRTCASSRPPRDAGPGVPEPGEAEPGLWTGILPIVTGYGEPVTAARLPADTPVSPSVLKAMRHGPPSGPR